MAVPVTDAELYRVEEVAALAGVHRATVWRDIRDGRLPVVHVGGRRVTRVRREDAERYLNGQPPTRRRS